MIKLIWPNFNDYNFHYVVFAPFKKDSRAHLTARQFSFVQIYHFAMYGLNPRNNYREKINEFFNTELNDNRTITQHMMESKNRPDWDCGFELIKMGLSVNLDTNREFAQWCFLKINAIKNNGHSKEIR